jgi:hypothetical protein
MCEVKALTLWKQVRVCDSCFDKYGPKEGAAVASLPAQLQADIFSNQPSDKSFFFPPAELNVTCFRSVPVNISESDPDRVLKVSFFIEIEKIEIVGLKKNPIFLLMSYFLSLNEKVLLLQNIFWHLT